MEKNFIALYNDFGDSCDGIPRYIGEYNTSEEAQKAMNEDIACYLKANGDELEKTIFNDNHIRLESGWGWGCEWYIIKKKDVR